MRLLLLGALLLVAAAAGLLLSLRQRLPGPWEQFRYTEDPNIWLPAAALLIAVSIVSFALAAIIRKDKLHRRRAENELCRMRQAAESCGDLISIVTTNGRVEFANAAVERVTGYERSELVGRRHRHFLPWYAESGLEQRVRATVLGGAEFVEEIDARTRQGDLLRLRERVTPFRDGAGKITRLISTARDLTRQQGLEDRLEYLDRYDPLTGLPNRRSFVKQLERAVEAARERKAFVSVLVLDIDRFKHVNDLCGAAAGDELLKLAARRIGTSIAPADIAARMGSDEFAVIHVDDAQPVLAGAVAQKLRGSLSQHFSVSGQDIVVTVSTGFAVYPGDGDDAWTLLKNADLALSQAKAQGRNAIQPFDRSITGRIKEFFVLEKRLFSALGNDEYLLHYQPYCDLRTRKVAGAEALIKWKNPDLGVISPSRFIPSLEDTGLIVDVGRWVLETACGQMREWERKNRVVPVSVNLSAVQFRHAHLVATVTDVVNNFRIDPARLTLEVTETVFMHDMEFSIRTLKRLKDVGVTLSVDDFGTGYSSLNYIKKLPVDNLKIDISFVRDVTRDQDAVSIVTAIVNLARGLGLKTIAEGVETEEQRNVLHLLRCDMGQGFLFSPALPAEEFSQRFP